MVWTIKPCISEHENLDKNEIVKEAKRRTNMMLEEKAKEHEQTIGIYGWDTKGLS